MTLEVGNTVVLDTERKLQNVKYDLGDAPDGSALLKDSTVFSGVRWGEYAGGNTAVSGSTAPTITVFESSGTWNRPDGCIAVIVEVQAAGGGSGNNYTGRGGGGGGGGYARKIIDVANTATATIVVGTGGDGGYAGTGDDGDAGGNSSWSDGVISIVATGGGGGGAGGIGAAGAGGNATGGDINIPGADGERGLSGFCQGGGSMLGSPAGSGIDSFPGNLYGGGASGSSAQAGLDGGKAGANGVIIVTELY